METQRKIQQGDILVHNIGYNMRIPVFTIVNGISASGKSAYIQEIASETRPDDEHGFHGTAVPTYPIVRKGEQRCVRLRDGGTSISIDKHCTRVYDETMRIDYDFLD